MSPLLYHWATPTSQSVALWGQCCVCASLHRGQNCRTCSGVCGPVWHGPRKLNATYNNDISADHESHMLGDVGHKVNKCRAVFWVSSQHQHLGPAKCHSMSQHFGGATGAMGCVLTLQALWRWGCFILWHFVITLDVHQSGVSGILMYNLQWEQERQRYIDKTAT